MAEEEFQESEVIFSDQMSNHYEDYSISANDDAAGGGGGGAYFDYRGFSKNGGFDDFEEEEDDEGEIVPPHVILGRRIAGKMAFSVCTGNGRTLKGRDLSQVRNSILRMTGFLEAEA
ncbi:Senescence regulator [Corchorus olitorius]|uniref:Senescence regulator n=1 Tax=Corchorus olitorius TaxID=93759 RepID=A0A1R3IJN1_9ROSI|nr:Senescence regulator [Corchorus olitorius]